MKSKLNFFSFGILLAMAGAGSATAAFAARDKAGNGGGGLLCGNTAVLYDLYEGERYFKLKFLPEPGANQSIYSERAYRKLLESYDVQTRAEIRKAFDGVRAEFEAKRQFTIPGEKLPLTPDADRFEIPAKCDPVQLATWNDRLDLVRIHEKYWPMLSEFHRAALFLHEVLYRIGRMQGRASDSDDTRKLVAQLMSTSTDLSSDFLFPKHARVATCEVGVLSVTAENELAYCRRPRSEGKSVPLILAAEIAGLRELRDAVTRQAKLAESGNTHCLRKRARREGARLEQQLAFVLDHHRAVGFDPNIAGNSGRYLDRPFVSEIESGDGAFRIVVDSKSFREFSGLPPAGSRIRSTEDQFPVTRAAKAGRIFLQFSIREADRSEVSHATLEIPASVTTDLPIRLKILENPSVLDD